MWIDINERAPKQGQVVIVKGFVRGGRKEQTMAAKLVRDPCDDKDFTVVKYWVALKNNDESGYRPIIKLRQVNYWQPLPSD